MKEYYTISVFEYTPGSLDSDGNFRVRASHEVNVQFHKSTGAWGDLWKSKITSGSSSIDDLLGEALRHIPARRTINVSGYRVPKDGIGLVDDERVERVARVKLSDLLRKPKYARKSFHMAGTIAI